MTPETEGLRERGRNLEEEFFRRQDAKLVAQLREKRQAEAQREALARASGITNPAVLDRLTQLGIRADTVAALRLVPLVAVAWADDTLDPAERAAILDRVHAAGITPGSTEHQLLERWIEHRPDAALLAAWADLIRGMCERITPDEAARLKARLLEGARAIAGASGGVLGLGKVSGAEAAALAALEAAFVPPA
jgi:hypothetical protein